ncbi:MAG: hypothetical protein AAF202_03865 [Pseudomonadota bacterium]
MSDFKCLNAIRVCINIRLLGCAVIANLRFFTIILICLQLGAAQAQSSCREEVAKTSQISVSSDPILGRLHDLLPRLSDDECIYDFVWARCHQNVVRLAKDIMSIWEDLEPSDFRFLYITTRTRFVSEGTSGRFRVNHPKYSFLEGKGWQHHVVVLFRGHILDLDYTSSPRPTPIAEYFETQFAGVEWEHESSVGSNELIVYEVSGEDYLAIDNLNSNEGQRKATELGQESPLSDYLNQ